MLADRTGERTEIGSVTRVGDAEEHFSAGRFQDRRIGLGTQAASEKQHSEERREKEPESGRAGMDHG